MPVRPLVSGVSSNFSPSSLLKYLRLLIFTKLYEQRFGVLEVLRVKPFGEPVVDLG